MWASGTPLTGSFMLSFGHSQLFDYTLELHLCVAFYVDDLFILLPVSWKPSVVCFSATLSYKHRPWRHPQNWWPGVERKLFSIIQPDRSKTGRLTTCSRHGSHEKCINQFGRKSCHHITFVRYAFSGVPRNTALCSDMLVGEKKMSLFHSFRIETVCEWY